MTDLKSCPFCGGESLLLHNAKRKIYGKDEYRIGVVACCNVCEARMFYGSESLATEAWNRRATIEPERKKGKWIKISPAGIYECSACGQNVMTNDIATYRWCHGCGADMRGE